MVKSKPKRNPVVGDPLEDLVDSLKDAELSIDSLKDAEVGP